MERTGYLRLCSTYVLIAILAITTFVYPSDSGSSGSPSTGKARSGSRLLSRWVRDIAALSDREAWAVSEKGYVMHTVDGGATWSHRQLKTISRLHAIAFIDARRGFVAGNDGVVLATTDGGQNWQPRQTNTTQTLSDLCFIGERGWAVGYWGNILHTNDGGLHWQKQRVLVDKPLESIFFVNEKLGWAVGWSRTILHTTDGGQSWKRQPTPRGVSSLSAVYFRDELHGWAVGMFGVILQTKDGGKTWRRQNHRPLRSVRGQRIKRRKSAAACCNRAGHYSLAKVMRYLRICRLS